MANLSIHSLTLVSARGILAAAPRPVSGFRRRRAEFIVQPVQKTFGLVTLLKEFFGISLGRVSASIIIVFCGIAEDRTNLCWLLTLVRFFLIEIDILEVTFP